MFACSVNAVFTVFAGFGVVNRVRLCSRVRGFTNTAFNCVREFACSLNAYVHTVVFAERVFAVRAATKICIYIYIYMYIYIYISSAQWTSISFYPRIIILLKTLGF